MRRRLFDAQLVNLVDEASRAPSPLNAQPARWRFLDDGVLLLEDTEGGLAGLDPTGRDSELSLGAALEGMSIALSWFGLKLWPSEEPAQPAAPVDGLRVRATCAIGGACDVDVLADAVRNRATWRGPMERIDGIGLHALAVALDHEDHAHVVRDAAEIQHAAALLADGAARRLQQEPTVRELRRRLRGMGTASNAVPVDAVTVGAVDALDTVERYLGDAATLQTASALVAVSKSASQSHLDAGRVLYRTWLRLTALGLRACPMSVLADRLAACDDELRARWGVADGDDIVAVLRVGRAPMNALLSPRLPPRSLIV